MRKIKSKDALDLIESSYFRNDYSKDWDKDPTLRRDYMEKTNATYAVIIAEHDAEERHANELQELKDRAIEAHRQCCKYKEDWFCSDLDNRTESGECDSNCQYIKLFSQKLNEK